jgi:hypothetical protein
MQERAENVLYYSRRMGEADFLGKRSHTFLSEPVTKDVKGKGKVVPLQAWSGPEGSRKLRFPECKAVPLQAWSGPEGSRKLRFPDF